MLNTFCDPACKNLRSRRLNDIRKFGTQSMAYSALQDGIQEFRHPSLRGFIAYVPYGGIRFVLSDPLMPERDFYNAAALFLQMGEPAVFCQISRCFARILNGLNCSVNSLGVEHVIELENFKVSWRRRKCLKSYMSKLSREKYFVFEFAAKTQNVSRISDQWLHNKNNGRELRFLARPFVSTHEEDVRYFYLVKDKIVWGFCSFDPVYSKDQDGKIRSLTLQHLRVANEAPLGSQDYLILNAFEQFKQEGFSWVSLGLSPLYQRINAGFNHSQFAELLFRLIYHFSFRYHYRTVGKHKDHYKARREQTYLALQKPLSLRQFWGLLRVNNLI